MACRNTPCKYHDAASPNGCKLFPGASWLNCRGASVRAASKKLTSTNKHKETK